MNWNAATATLLSDLVANLKRAADLATRVQQHGPCQLGDLGGAKTCLDRE
ncbi:hypothetical protein V1289_005216 [Bradyrhizobium sp. AZCC 2289]